jgi:hypothetical protein
LRQHFLEQWLGGHYPMRWWLLQSREVQLRILVCRGHGKKNTALPKADGSGD